MMLLCAKDINLLGTTVCPGDCYKEFGSRAARRYLEFFGSSRVPVAAGDDEGINKFPDEWRADSKRLAELAELNGAEGMMQVELDSAADFISKCLRAAAERVSIIITGPPTHLGEVLSMEPSFRDKIERVWVMGGAVRVRGNVKAAGHDGSAEWNFFNHPKAADLLIRSGVSMTLVSLDATNKAPVTRDFLERLAAQAQTSRVSKLALATWKVALRHIEHADYTQRYYFWDTLTAAAMLEPSLLKTESMRIKVVTDGPSQGRTVEDRAGSVVDVGVDVNSARLESLILDLFKR